LLCWHLLYFGVNFCYAEDDVNVSTEAETKSAFKSVQGQILEKLTNFANFNTLKTNVFKVKVTSAIDKAILEDKNATVTLKFNASAKRKAFINAKEEWEAKRQASDGTKVEIEEEGSSPSENSRLQDAMNRAQVDSSTHGR
jgi:hypothetical protein